MGNLQDYIKPELLVLIPVLYFVGIGLKQSKVKNKYIPWVLMGAGVCLATLYVLGTSGINSIAVFTAVTQGILCAGASVYVDQLVKQTHKDE